MDPQPHQEQTANPAPFRKPAVEHVVNLKGFHTKQDHAYHTPAKRKIIRAGRRSGKTVGVATYSVEEFLKGRRILYAVPTSDQLKRFWTEVSAALAAPIAAGLFYKNESEHIIERRGTSQRIRAKTAWNADTLRGDYADLLILDEFQLMNESAWEDVGAPMLIDNNGDAIFIYTPPTLNSKSVSKARDLQHAPKRFKQAKLEMDLAQKEGRASRWLAVHFTSYDNPFLSVEGLGEVTKDLTSASHKKEIMAEDTEEVPGALWKLPVIDALRVTADQVPDLEMIVVGVDPSGSSTTEAGICCAGRGRSPLGTADDGRPHIYVLDDRSLAAPTSRTWAQAAVNLYFERRADRLLGERNYGGDMVESTIRQVDGGANVSYADAQATRGKMVRAEPVAAAYETDEKRGKVGVVHHVGVFPELEDEMCNYVPGRPSPNRMDALVWCVLRLIEGVDVLGLVDFMKSGGEQALKNLEKIQHATNLAKPVTHEGTERCPSCNCVTGIQPVPGGQRRCAECGVQWWPNGGQPKPGAPSRAEHLLKSSGRVR